MKKLKIVTAVTGASGSIYAKVFLEKLKKLKPQLAKTDLIFSKNAKAVWHHEIGLETIDNQSFEEYDINDFHAPFASGSAGYDAMVIIPCSMGTMGRIATGVSSNLISRTADVILKERKKLVLVIRDTPYNLIHINNMKAITEAGGIICPASPSLYSQPQTFNHLAATVVDRVIDLVGLEQNTYRWGTSR